MDNIININSCNFKYPNSKDNIIHIDSLSIKSGEHIFLRGKSGIGKSTFLNLLTGVLEPQSGNIEVLGVDLTTLNARQKDRFRGDNFGIVFQQFNLLPYLSVEENLSLVSKFSKQKSQNIQDLTKEIDAILEAVEIPNEMKYKKAMQLSVGEQQRVSLARALLGKPKIIIADEPTSALDKETKEKFMKLLFKQVEAQKSTLIFVSHDIELTPYFKSVYDFNEINRSAE
ncbi:MAG: putative ABC transport system ATP-binding protein [Sulfurimonas sp.]|jgi:putative ABC transport system ATP-binding protein